jgi:hypothetical protein
LGSNAEREDGGGGESNVSDPYYDLNLKSVSAKLFLDAKVIEHEAACFGGSAERITQCEENCRSALAALLDAKRENVNASVNRYRPTK